MPKTTLVQPKSKEEKTGGVCVRVEMEMSTEECRRRERKEGERRKGATKIG